MGYIWKRAIACMAMSIMLTQPAQACWSDQSITAAKIMNLKNMLMVNALRCRFGEDNYLANYNGFLRINKQLISSQNIELHSHFTLRYGKNNVVAELDRFNTSLANMHGNGHPTLSCGELKLVTQGLNKPQNLDDLLFAAQTYTQVERLSTKFQGGQCKTRFAGRK